MRKVLFLLSFCAVMFQINAQISETELDRMDQTMARINNTLPVIVLDKATTTVYYRFIQQAMLDNTPVFLTDTVVLKIGGVYSVYYNWSSVLRDSIVRAPRLQINPSEIRLFQVVSDVYEFEEIGRAQDGVITEEPAPESIRIFKNRQTNIVTSIDGTVSEMFLAEEIIPPMEWIIFPDTMTILGYLCFKATTNFRGREYIAWFAPDIPINTGPWKIYGLPGLILHLEDEDRLFVYKAIRVTNHAEIPITMYDDLYTRVTNEQLQGWIENQRDYIGRTMLSNGVMYVSQRRNPLTFHRREIEN